MDGWIKWLGEFVWRISKVPSDIRGNEGDENFWFRLYGVLTLLMSLGVSMLMLRFFWVTPLSKMFIMLSQYTQGDKILGQSYFVAGLVIVVAVPIIFAAMMVLAAVLGILPALALRLSKLAAWASLKWATRFRANQQIKELTPDQKEAFMVLLLGILAAFIVWAAIKAGALPPQPPAPKAPPEPPQDENDDAQPAA